MNIENQKHSKLTKFRYGTFVICFITSQASFSEINSISSASTSSAASVSTSTSTSSSSGSTTKVDKIVTGSYSAECEGSTPSPYFPLRLFLGISKPSSPLEYEIMPDNKIRVKFPLSLNNCGKFIPELVQDKFSKNITILIRNETYKDYSSYIKCLENKAVLKDNNFYPDAVPKEYFSKYSYDLDFDFDKNKDYKKTITLSYGHPEMNSDYGISKELIEKDRSGKPQINCISTAKWHKDVIYINKGQDVIIEELKATCRTGDAQKIAEARKSLGNAEALKDIFEKVNSELEAGYLVAAEKDVDKIFTSMTKVEDKLTADGEAVDEVKAKKLVKDYTDLAKNLDRTFLNPAITRLDNLMRKVETMDQDDPHREEIINEIKKINEKIGAFAARKNAFSQVYSAMEKFSINDSAKVIEDIRLKSFYYGKVYPSSLGKGALSFDDANIKQVKGLKKFEATLNDWDDQYQVSKGNLYPINKVEKERAATNAKMNKRWADFNQNENVKLQKYCSNGMLGSMKNPTQCKSFQMGARQRMEKELNNRTKDLRYIQGRGDKLNKMTSGYNKYQANKSNEEGASNEGDEPYDSPYSTYDDNFSDKYPGYYNGQNITPYDPGLYNLGTQGAGMMGNNGGYPNPQMPIQPGQYQMNQGGGWPGM